MVEILKNLIAALNHVSVEGIDNMKIMTGCVDTLQNLVNALEKSTGVTIHDDGGQGEASESAQAGEMGA